MQELQLTGTKLWRLSLSAIFGFGWLFLVPLNAYATCINHIQSQTIAAAYNGDQIPTVHHMDTCSGDDISYQIPIASTITFDGVQYDNIYATTNSVITFGQPDGTYWQYPNTPSISLYSMDWYPGVSNTEGLDIYYSEGGFQINLNMVPYGNYGAQPSTVNILVAITNTGGISVAYSYQGPEYQNLRTGVRLHNGDIVSLEAWGATQIEAGEPTPTLQAEPVADPTSSPEPTPITPEQQQAVVAEAAQLAGEISELNNLIAAINGEEPNEPEPQPSQETSPEPEPSQEPTIDPDLPEPDIEVEPEIVTPEDPRFPDDEEQTEPDSPNPSPSSDTTDAESEDEEPTPEPSEETIPQPEDTDPAQEPEQDLPVDEEVVNLPSNNNNTDSPISEEELNKLNKLIGVNDAKLAAELSNMLTELSLEDKKEVASDLGIKAEEVELIAEAIKDNPVLAVAVLEFSNRAEQNAEAPMPYTLADATTEIAAEQFLDDPIGAFTNIDLDKVLDPSQWGKDMTDDQREKAQEVIVPVIIASNIVAAAMTRRIG
jgi:hypothetical protein